MINAFLIARNLCPQREKNSAFCSHHVSSAIALQHFRVPKTVSGRFGSPVLLFVVLVIATIFAGLFAYLIILDKIDSTNNYAMQLIDKNAVTDGLTIIANEQTNGKGQRGKVWETEKGMNLALSLLVKPDFLTISQQFQLSVVTALACYDFFSR